MAIGNAPCKGKSFMYCLGVLKLLPLQGDNLASITTQGSALGIIAIGKAPCKGKSFVYCLEFLKLLPLQGAKFANMITQGVALG